MAADPGPPPGTSPAPPEQEAPGDLRPPRWALGWRRWLPGYGRAELETACILIVAAVVLSALNYYGKPYAYPPLRSLSARELLEKGDSLTRDREELRWVRGRELQMPQRFVPAAFVWWAGACVICYVLVPLAAVLVIRRGRPLELGLSVRGLHHHLRTYLLLFALIAPVVVAVSFTPAFRQTYPFLLTAHTSVRDWLLFEACYLLQFACLEFFFRGFLLFSLEPHLGRKAIFVMVIPYCMIHFGKPFAETLGAIVAGVVLGELALRLRSIWGGVLIHCAVAVLMDVLALWHAGSLARLFGGQ